MEYGEVTLGELPIKAVGSVVHSLVRNRTMSTRLPTRGDHSVFAGFTASRLGRTSMLQNLVDSKILTDAGRNWLITAIDPFHDYELQLEGYPDDNGARSIVERHITSFNVSATSASANWDCAILNMPWQYKTNATVDQTFWPATKTNLATSAFDTSGLFSAELGPVTMLQADEGETLLPSNPDYTLWIPTSFDSAAYANSVNWGQQRVIGWGIEIHNTTADVYKQGSLTCYTVPQQWSDGGLILNNAEVDAAQARTGLTRKAGDQALIYDANAKVVASTATLPAIAPTMSLPPGARVWEAADGVYSIISMANENRFERTVASITQLARHEVVTTGTMIIDPHVVDTTVMVEETLCRNHFNTNVMYFQGLSNQTTLNVITKCYVEYLPEHPSGLLQLSTPSPPLDMAALKLYSVIVDILPHFVPVHMNAAGDYWRYAMKAIKFALPIVGVAISPFVGPEVNLATSALAKMADWAGQTSDIPKSQSAQNKTKNNKKGGKKGRQRKG